MLIHYNRRLAKIKVFNSLSFETQLLENHWIMRVELRWKKQPHIFDANSTITIFLLRDFSSLGKQKSFLTKFSENKTKLNSQVIILMGRKRVEKKILSRFFSPRFTLGHPEPPVFFFSIFSPNWFLSP